MDSLKSGDACLKTLLIFKCYKHPTSKFSLKKSQACVRLHFYSFLLWWFLGKKNTTGCVVFEVRVFCLASFHDLFEHGVYFAHGCRGFVWLCFASLALEFGFEVGYGGLGLEAFGVLSAFLVLVATACVAFGSCDAAFV